MLVKLIPSQRRLSQMNSMKTKLGLQWQWQANPKPYWAFPSNGKLKIVFLSAT